MDSESTENSNGSMVTCTVSLRIPENTEIITIDENGFTTVHVTDGNNVRFIGKYNNEHLVKVEYCGE